MSARMQTGIKSAIQVKEKILLLLTFAQNGSATRPLNGNTVIIPYAVIPKERVANKNLSTGLLMLLFLHQHKRSVQHVH